MAKNNDAIGVLTQGDCPCGYGPGSDCHPSCPRYVSPPPAEVTGTVSLKGKIRGQEPDNATYHRFLVPGTTDGQRIVQLLGKDSARCRALLWANGSTSSVLIGRRDSVGNGVGAEILAGTSPVELKNQDEVYAWNEGTDSVTVNVVNERYTT